MGNGHRETCTVPGTPYSSKGSWAGKPSPNCGYRSGYPRPGTYRVSAVSFWSVHWTASNDVQGDLDTTRTSRGMPIQINELQVVTE